MEKKSYTYFSLQFKGRMFPLLLGIAIVLILVTVYEYFFDTLQLTDYRFFSGYIVACILMFIYKALNVVVVSDEGVKTYGLFNRKKYFSWNKIQSVGLAVNQFGVVSEIDKLNDGKIGAPIVYLSLKKPEKVDFSFLYRSPQTIRFPYRKDIHSLVLEKLALANN